MRHGFTIPAAEAALSFTITQWLTAGKVQRRPWPQLCNQTAGREVLILYTCSYPDLITIGPVTCIQSPRCVPKIEQQHCSTSLSTIEWGGGLNSRRKNSHCSKTAECQGEIHKSYVTFHCQLNSIEIRSLWNHKKMGKLSDKVTCLDDPPTHCCPNPQGSIPVPNPCMQIWVWVQRGNGNPGGGAQGCINPFTFGTPQKGVSMFWISLNITHCCPNPEDPFQFLTPVCKYGYGWV